MAEKREERERETAARKVGVGVMRGGEEGGIGSRERRERGLRRGRRRRGGPGGTED